MSPLEIRIALLKMMAAAAPFALPDFALLHGLGILAGRPVTKSELHEHLCALASDAVAALRRIPQS